MPNQRDHHPTEKQKYTTPVSTIISLGQEQAIDYAFDFLAQLVGFDVSGLSLVILLAFKMGLRYYKKKQSISVL